MGLRGSYANSRKKAQEELRGKRKVVEVWNRKGLTRVQRIVAFLEFLPITKGKLAGKKMRLLPGQKKFIEDFYGDKKKKLGIKSEPRGQGKTGLLAGLSLCHLVGPEAEVRGEVFSAAIDRQQAGIMFNEMEAIILAVPEFAARVNIVRFFKKIEVLGGQGEGSTYEALSADARRAHGLAPSLWVYDELAQAKDRELLDNLMTAMGKRNDSRGLIISTQAPDDEHPLSQLIDDGLSGKDESILVDLVTTPVDADVFDPDVIRKVNPALGIFLDEETVLKEAERAKRIPAFEPAFRNLRHNQRVDARVEERIVPASVWRACATPVILQKLKRGRAYGGLDLSGVDDLTALILAHPDGKKDKNFDLTCNFWTPAGQLENRTPAERDLFKLWINQGHLTPVPGPVIRYRYVAQRLAELNEEYDLIMVGFDRWGVKFLLPELEDIGLNLNLEPFGQGFQDMSPAINYLAELALTKRLRHGGNPILTSCIANAIVVQDPAGNKKIDKDKSNRRATTRIDGAVAAAMALGTARKHMGVPGKAALDDFLKNAVAV